MIKRKVDAVIFILLILVLSSAVAKGKAPIAVLRIDNSVRTVGWNSDTTLFSYGEGVSAVIRDSKTLDIADNVIFDQEVISMQFADKTSGAGEQLMTFLINGAISMWHPGDENALLLKSPSNNEITAVGLSFNGDCFALGTRNGPIDYTFQLYYSKSSINIKLSGHTSAIYEINFSDDSKKFVSSSLDGTFRIWDSVSGNCDYVLENFEYNYFPAIFYPDNEKLISAADDHTLIVWGKDGIEIDEIKVDLSIHSYEIAKDREHIIVLTTNNQFHYYSLINGKHEGYIPYFNPTALTAHEFSTDGTRLIIGHDDGSIYLIDVEDVFCKPYEHPGKYKMYLVGDGSEWKFDATSQRGTQKGIDKQKAREKKKEEEKKLKKAKGISWGTSHNLDFRAGAKYTSVEPYDWGMYFEAGYVNDYIIYPFYLGGAFSPFFFFPIEDFPYKYEIADVALPNPYLVGYDLNFTAGREWHPKNKKLGIFAEAYFNGGMRQITSPTIGSGNLASSIGGGLTGGLRYNGFSLQVSFGYDSMLLFNMNMGLGYRFRIRQKKMVDTEEKFQELLEQINEAQDKGGNNAQ